MKAPQRALRSIAAIALLFGVAAGLHAWLTPTLPYIKLQSGWELRVLQVKYGPGNEIEHALGRSPEWKFRVWKALPARLHKVMSAPDDGWWTYSSDRPAVSVWWAWIALGKHEPQSAVTSDVTVTLDSGESLPPIPTYDLDGDGGILIDPPRDPSRLEFRSILVVDPPRDSRRLRLEFRVDGEPVRFTVDNPAYHKP